MPKQSGDTNYIAAPGRSSDLRRAILRNLAPLVATFLATTLFAGGFLTVRTVGTTRTWSA